VENFPPLNTDNEPEKSAAIDGGDFTDGDTPRKTSNWLLSILLIFIAFGSAFRYFFLDNRQTWREKDLRAEFRFVTIAAGIGSLGIMIPIILRRWCLANGGEIYRKLWMFSAAIPVTGIAIFPLFASESATISGWSLAIVFLWEIALIGGSVFAGLIPVAAIEAPPKVNRAQLPKKRRFA